jgi:hypothetical protein
MATNQSTTPSAPDVPVPEPEVKPSSTPDGPQVVPSPSTPPGEPGPDPEPDEDIVGAPAGAMGVSSERVPADPGSIEGTGSRGTATGSCVGTWPTSKNGVTQEWREDEPAVNVDPAPRSEPGVTSGTHWEGIDRTVGERNPAKVSPHDFNPTTNPGHSHG